MLIKGFEDEHTGAPRFVFCHAHCLIGQRLVLSLAPNPHRLNVCVHEERGFPFFPRLLLLLGSRLLLTALGVSQLLQLGVKNCLSDPPLKHQAIV